MAKYQPSKYYADDKDIHDILSSPKISTKCLLAQARQRGIFLSEESPREEIVHYMSKLPFSRPQLQAVMEEVTREDREEKLTTCKVSTGAQLDEVQAAIEKVKEARGEQMREDYVVTQNKEGRLQVKITYSEPDFQKARLIQRREREAVVEIGKGKDGIEVRHTQNERTDAILTSILAALAPPDVKEKPSRQTIELSGIKNHEHRTQFFINLIGGMEGFQLREVRDLKTDRLAEEPKEGDEAKDEDQAKADSDQLKAMVRRVALTGENILVSPQYQQLAKDGFFISRVLWTSIETTGKGRVFEFEAEFKDAQNAANFAYQVRGVYTRDGDGEISKTRTELADTEKNQLKDCLEAAAYESVEKVGTLQNPQDQPTAS